MKCLPCQSAQTSERPERTELGYRRFRCRTCGREGNERTGTAFKRLAEVSLFLLLDLMDRTTSKESVADAGRVPMGTIEWACALEGIVR